jgi:hypothetical protein
MRSNKSSRRGFFGKTLAWLGAAFACSKAAAAPVAPSARSLASISRSPNSSQRIFRLYDEQGQLLEENIVITYAAAETTNDYGSVHLSKYTSYECDPQGRLTAGTFADPL